MHDSGLLGQMFPEFKAISCRVVRDFYHKYTVDEHTLLTIRNLERLVERGAGAASGSAGCSARSTFPSCWCWRCCYHDVGKSRDDDVITSRARAWRAQMSERLHLDRESRETVEFLVAHHLDDVGGGVPPRHRGPRDRPAVRRDWSASKTGSRCCA